MIPYGKHSVDRADIEAVVAVLESHYLTQGEFVPAFEKALCDYSGARFAQTVNSGTSGLHVACLALGVGDGDWVWTSPNSFVASANCARYCGAQVDFVDIDPCTYNLCTDKLAQKLEWAKQQNKLPKALVVVHFAGFSADMQRIAALTEPLGIALIEDAAHAFGGEYQGRKVGSCQYSDMTVLSFHPVKSITTAEGGAVLTNTAELAQKLELFAKHGVSRDATLLESTEHLPSEPWIYQQLTLGYNYRLSDIHAVLGISQLTKLDSFVQQRDQHARRYMQKLADLPLVLPTLVADTKSAWHLFMLQVESGVRAELYHYLQQSGIGVNVHYIPIHLQPYYQNLGFNVGDFPNAESYYQKAITLPLYPGLQQHQQDKVIAALTEALIV